MCALIKLKLVFSILIWLVLREGEMKKIPRRDWLSRDQDLAGAVLTVQCPLLTPLVSAILHASISADYESILY